MKTRRLLLGAGVLASAAVAVFGDRTPDGAVAEPAPHAAAARPAGGIDPGAATTSAAPAGARKTRPPPMILALRARAELLGASSPDLFVSQTFDAPSPPPPREKAASAPPPSAPPVPFTFIGKKFEGTHWEVYLASGDRTYFVREGSVIDRDYAVNAIKPPTLTLTYLPLKQMQTMTIGGAD